MKEKSKTVLFPMYKYKIHIVKTTDIMLSRNNRSGIIGHELVMNGGQPEGLHSYNKDEAEAFIFLEWNSNMGVLCHECYHGITRLFRWIQAEHEEEVFAYHLGYLVEQANSLFHKP